ncbi:MAG TPA: hypothetical protein VFI47_04670 [Acidimicrobiales bacterium]|nr:hypothetical protein [Acidimicrobiales bacterium]
MDPTIGGDGGARAEERAREGVEHLQAAARELIAAARAALDVAEEVVADPDALSSLAGMLATMGDAARRAAGGAGRAGRAAPGSADVPGADDGGEPRVTRITVA